jgi:hypothetical protein
MAPLAGRSTAQQQLPQPVIIAATVSHGKHSVMDRDGLVTAMRRRNFYSKACIAKRQMSESNRTQN